MLFLKTNKICLDLFLQFHHQTWMRVLLDLSPVFESPDPYLLPCPMPLVLLHPSYDGQGNYFLPGSSSPRFTRAELCFHSPPPCFMWDPWHRPLPTSSLYFQSWASVPCLCNPMFHRSGQRPQPVVVLVGHGISFQWIITLFSVPRVIARLPSYSIQLVVLYSHHLWRWTR